MKRLPSPRALWWAGALFLFTACVWLSWPLEALQVRDTETEEVYFCLPVREGETVRLSWIHSIERTPWVEEYEIKEGQFFLREVRVKSFGAGVDVEATQVWNQNGWVVMRGMNRADPKLRFFYSSRAQYQLQVDGHSLALQERVDPHRPLEIRVQTCPRIRTMIDGGRVS